MIGRQRKKKTKNKDAKGEFKGTKDSNTTN